MTNTWKTLLTISLLLLCLLQVRLSVAQDRVLVNEVIYDVPIFNGDAYTVKSGMVYGDWWDCNIESSTRISFQRMLLSKARSGAIRVTDEDGRQLDPNEVAKMHTVYDTVQCQQLSPPFEKYDTFFQVGINPDDIQWIRFKEQWTYDTGSYAIHKRIIAYAPLWIAYDRNGNRMGEPKPLFWIQCTDAINEPVVLTPLIAYRLPVYKNVEQPGYLEYESISGDSLSLKDYFSVVMEDVYFGKLRIYESNDVFSYYRWSLDSISFLPLEVAAYKIDLTDTFVLTHPYPPYDEYDTVVPDRFGPDQTVGLQFFERWLLDPVTMQLEKEVIGADIMSGCYDYHDDPGSSRPYFHIAFRRPERNFLK